MGARSVDKIVDSQILQEQQGSTDFNKWPATYYCGIDAIIIGSGMGAFPFVAIVAKLHKGRVLVRHFKIGGRTHTFNRPRRRLRAEAALFVAERIQFRKTRIGSAWKVLRRGHRAGYTRTVE